VTVLNRIEASTREIMALGVRVLQVHRFADGERAHVRRLADWADLPPGASVVDLGSGTGEVARIWAQLRADLHFTLVNFSQMQLDCTPGFRAHCCDMTAVPERDGAFDAAICLFAIGHVDVAAAFGEIARLVRPGGIVFVYDMNRISGSHEPLAAVDYRVESREVMEARAAAAGLRLDFYLEPSDRGEFGRSLFGDQYDHFFDGVIPAIWRWTKTEALHVHV